MAGYSGFVGSHLYDVYTDAVTFDSKNLDAVHDQSFDLFLCACVPAVKWHANAHPSEDLDVIGNIRSHLDRMRHCGKFVLISTIDAEACADEPYGRNRLAMEEWCRERFEAACVVVRLPALFGLGLKKNIIYDLLNRRLLDKIDPHSVFQWYDLRWLRRDLELILATPTHNNRCVALYSEPVETIEILKDVFPELLDRVVFPGTELERTSVRYCCASEKSFERTKDRVISSMREFVEVYRATRDADFCSRLAVSNFCWGDPCYDDHAARIMRKYNVSKVELAPSMYADWEDMDAKAISDIAASWARRSMVPVSFQAILHGVESPNDGSAIVGRLNKVAELAEAAGVGILVLGSPSLRREPLDADAWVDILRRVKVPRTVRICVEPNSAKYGCRVGTNVRHVQDILDKVDRESCFAINFDAGNAYMESDDSSGIIPFRIGHVQISAPYLGNFTKDLSTQYAASGYCRIIEAAVRDGSCVSLEVRGDVTDLSENIWNFVLFLRRVYINPGCLGIVK